MATSNQASYVASQDAVRKIVFLGDQNVGKTSLISRFVSNSMPSHSAPTVGAAEHSRTIYLNQSSRNLNLELWDVSGQDKFRALTNMYYRDADGAILVFDVTDKESFENLKQAWIKDIEEKAPENIQIAIVGNKSDRVDSEVVTFKEAHEFALQNRAILQFVSAKKNQGLNEVFQKLGEKLVQQPSNMQSGRNSVKLKNGLPGHKRRGKKSKCCTIF
eukprot:403352881